MCCSSQVLAGRCLPCWRLKVVEFKNKRTENNFQAASGSHHIGVSDRVMCEAGLNIITILGPLSTFPMSCFAASTVYLRWPKSCVVFPVWESPIKAKPKQLAVFSSDKRWVRKIRKESCHWSTERTSYWGLESLIRYWGRGNIRSLVMASLTKLESLLSSPTITQFVLVTVFVYYDFQLYAETLARAPSHRKYSARSSQFPSYCKFI